MVVVDRKYAGAAVATTVSGSMTAGSPGGGGTFTVADATGYPLTGKFPVVIDRGLATEEKILVASISGTTFTVSARGYDGTTAQSHNASASCELALDAVSVNLFVDHVDDIETDPHSTKLLNNTRHDVTARHTFGAALGIPTTPAAVVANQAGSAGAGSIPPRQDHTHPGPVTATAVSVGTANGAGSGTNMALANHVHAIGAGAINSSGMFAADVVDSNAIAANAVGATEIAADAVGASELANGAVAVTADVVDGIITLAKMASEASTDFTPAASTFATGSTLTVGTGGTTYGHYFKLGRIVVGWCGWNMAADGNLPAGGTMQVPLPVAMRTVGADGFRCFVAARLRRASDGFVSSGTGVITGGSSASSNIVTAGVSAAWDATTPINPGTPGDGACSFDALFAYEAAT